MSKNLEIQFSVNHKRVIKVLSFIVLILVVFNLVAIHLQYNLHYPTAFTFIPKFKMDMEGNIPTFFSCIILFFSSFLFRLIAIVKKRTNDSFYRYWFGLSIIFFIMGFDEGFILHEIISGLLSVYKFSGIFYYSWLIVAIVLLLLFVAAYLKFFLSLPNFYKFHFFSAALIYLAGAVGMEMMDGLYASHYGQRNIIYGLLATIEETLEMGGVVYLINTLFNYLRNYLGMLSFYI